jgi:AcrR family transcriptional regulator
LPVNEDVLIDKKNRHQKRTEKTRQRLLLAAKTLFAEKGMDLTTIDEITNKADTGKGTFYYHFKTKEMLINDLIDNILNELEETIAGQCAKATDLREVLERILNAHIIFFNNRWEDFVLYFQGRADLILEKGYEGIDTPFISYINAIGAEIDKAVNYELSKSALLRVACAISGFISGYYSFSTISSDTDEDTEKVFEPVRGALVASLSRFVNTALAETKTR